MIFKELDTVVLDADIEDAGLRRGDLGAVVQVIDTNVLLVEFVTAAGQTQALVEMRHSDLRPVRDTDLLSVRTVNEPA